jgi:lipid II:glycine glycyltransferase (peptidoglycan interpeptide bridge formation enzyme)
MGTLQVEHISPQSLRQPGSFLQSPFWARFKGVPPLSACAFRVRGTGSDQDVLAFLRRLPQGFTLLYVPHGPQRAPEDDLWGGFLAQIAREIRSYVPSSCLLVRFDLPWTVPGPGVVSDSLPDHLERAPTDIQPPSTVVVDLRPAAENLLDQMKSKTRYNIRLAGRKGVEVTEGTSADMPAWYALYQETAVRDRIQVHDQEYYQRFFETGNLDAGDGTSVRLYLARANGELLAGNLVVFHDDTATYVFGASSGEKRNLMPTYALQWHAMIEAKRHGCSWYDLYGVSPTEDPSHPMHGLYRFKTGFGGRVVHRPGCWDYPYRSLVYRGYRTAESMRKFYFQNVKKGRILG